jgi:hypothetical protein
MQTRVGICSCKEDVKFALKNIEDARFRDIVVQFNVPRPQTWLVI